MLQRDAQGRDVGAVEPVAGSGVAIVNNAEVFFFIGVAQTRRQGQLLPKMPVNLRVHGPGIHSVVHGPVVLKQREAVRQEQADGAQIEDLRQVGLVVFVEVEEAGDVIQLGT